MYYRAESASLAHRHSTHDTHTRTRLAHSRTRVVTFRCSARTRHTRASRGTLGQSGHGTEPPHTRHSHTTDRRPRPDCPSPHAALAKCHAPYRIFVASSLSLARRQRGCSYAAPRLRASALSTLGSPSRSVMFASLRPSPPLPTQTPRRDLRGRGRAKRGACICTHLRLASLATRRARMRVLHACMRALHTSVCMHLHACVMRLHAPP